MKLVCVLFIILSITFDFAMSVDLQCSFEYLNWVAVVGRIYYCSVQNNLNIISSGSAVITGATGNHESSKNNDDVHGFYVASKKIEIFPRELEKIYKNLKLIIIYYGRIKEIHQSDLKPFPQLEYLNLDENDIEVLEEGLFDFNPKLGYISFSFNKISQIYPNVFDHLTKLTYLFLYENQCINKNVHDNSAGVKELIKEIKFLCPSLSFAHKEVQKLKLNFIDLDFQLTEKLTNVEKTCQNSFLDMSQKISKLETKSLEFLTEVNKMEATIQANDNFIKATDTRYHKNMQALSRAIAAQNMASNNKIDKLEKAVKTNEQNLQTLKSDIFAAFGKILEKLEENRAKIEQRTAPKMEAIMTTLKSQNLAFSTLNEKMKNLEAGLATLQSELFEGKTTGYSSCGLNSDENSN